MDFQVGLNAEYFIDPEVFALERERVFYNDWVCIGHAGTIPDPGDFFTCTVLDQQLIAVRDEDGGVQVHFNVCRHRGSLLVAEPSGTLKGRMVCPYHSWAYDLRGHLVAAPHTQGLRDFCKENYPLKSIHHAVREGVIFVHFGTEPARSIDAHLGDLVELMRRREVGRLRRTHRQAYVVDANWKIVSHNTAECAHCPSVHPEFNHIAPSSTKSDIIDPNGEYIASWQDLREGSNTLTVSGTTDRRPLPGVNVEERRRNYFYLVFPSTLVNIHPDYVTICYIWPLSVDKTSVIREHYFHPDQMSAPDFDGSDVTDFWGLTYEQDWRLCELSHAGMRSSRGFEPGPYFDEESLLPNFDRYLLKQLGRAP